MKSNHDNFLEKILIDTEKFKKLFISELNNYKKNNKKYFFSFLYPSESFDFSFLNNVNLNSKKDIADILIKLMTKYNFSDGEINDADKFVATIIFHALSGDTSINPSELSRFIGCMKILKYTNFSIGSPLSNVDIYLRSYFFYIERLDRNIIPIFELLKDENILTEKTFKNLFEISEFSYLTYILSCIKILKSFDSLLGDMAKNNLEKLILALTTRFSEDICFALRDFNQYFSQDFSQIDANQVQADFDDILKSGRYARDVGRALRMFTQVTSVFSSHAQENRDAIVNAGENAVNVANGLAILANAGALSSENRESIIKAGKNAENVANGLVILANAGALSEENRQAIIDAGINAVNVANGLVILDNAGALSTENREAILNARINAVNVANGFAILANAGMLSTENREAIINARKNAVNVANGLVILDNAGALSTENREAIISAGIYAENVANGLVILDKENLSSGVDGQINREMLIKAGRLAEQVANKLVIFNRQDFLPIEDYRSRIVDCIFPDDNIEPSFIRDYLKFLIQNLDLSNPRMSVGVLRNAWLYGPHKDLVEKTYFIFSSYLMAAVEQGRDFARILHLFGIILHNYGAYYQCFKLLFDLGSVQSEAENSDNEFMFVVFILPNLSNFISISTVNAWRKMSSQSVVVLCREVMEFAEFVPSVQLYASLNPIPEKRGEFTDLLHILLTSNNHHLNFLLLFLHQLKKLNATRLSKDQSIVIEDFIFSFATILGLLSNNNQSIQHLMQIIFCLADSDFYDDNIEKSLRTIGDFIACVSRLSEQLCIGENVAEGYKDNHVAAVVSMIKHFNKELDISEPSQVTINHASFFAALPSSTEPGIARPGCY